MTIEKLTEKETERLLMLGSGCKALSIIDAQAAHIEELEAGPTPDWVEVLQNHVDRVLAAESERAAALTRAEAAERLLARAQDGGPKRPVEANRDQVQLDYDIGHHLQRQGWQWDAINRKWRQP